MSVRFILNSFMRGDLMYGLADIHGVTKSWT